MVNQLFENSDADGSGGIDREEFNNIVRVVFAQMTGRLIIYVLVLLMFVPYIASLAMAGLGDFFVDGTYLYDSFERILSMVAGVVLLVNRARNGGLVVCGFVEEENTPSKT